MQRSSELLTGPSELQQATAYEAPRIETVLTPEELEREVLYAGASRLSQPPP